MDKVVGTITMLLSAVSVESFCPVCLGGKTLADAFIALEGSNVIVTEDDSFVINSRTEAIFVAYALDYPELLFRFNNDECRSTRGLLDDFLIDDGLQLNEGLVDEVKKIKEMFSSIATRLPENKLQPDSISKWLVFTTTQINWGAFWRRLPFRWKVRLLYRIAEEVDSTDERIMKTKYRILGDESIKGYAEFDQLWLDFSHLAKRYAEEASRSRCNIQ